MLALLATFKVWPDVSIKPPLPVAPIAFADKVPAIELLSPHTKTLPPLPLVIAFAERLLLASTVVNWEVGTVITEERLGRSAS